MDNKELMASDEADALNKSAAPDPLDGLPKEVRSMMRYSFSMMNANMREPSLADKFTPENIDKALDIQKDGMQLEHKDNNTNRLFMLAVILVIAAIIVTILVLFRDNPDMVEKILYAAGGLLAGAVGGYGYGKSKRSE